MSFKAGDASLIIQNRRKTKENSYAVAFEGSLYSGDLYWGCKLAFSVCLSVPPSVCRGSWSLAWKRFG